MATLVATQDAALEPTVAQRNVLLATFTGAHLAHHTSNSLLNPLLPLIRDAFALSYAQSGFLVSAFALSLGISNAPVGVLADRVGSRPVIVGGLVLTSLVMLLIAGAGAYWQLLVLMVLLGVIGGSYHAPAGALLARAFPARIRGAAMGFHVTGGHLSFFLTPLAAGAMIVAGGSWQSPYLWLAIAPVTTGALVWLLTNNLSEQRAATGLDRWAVFREVGTVLRVVGPLVSVSLLFGMVYSAVLAFLSLYLVDARGLPAPTAAALFGYPMLVGVVGAPLGGYVSDRLGRQAVIVLGMVVLGPSVYLMTVVPNEWLLLPLTSAGICTAMRATVTEVLVTETAPDHRRATILGGYYMLAQELGGLAAPALGILAGVVGIGQAFGAVGGGLAAVSGAVVLSAPLLARRR